MKLVLILACMAAITISRAHAQDEPLPERVAQAYLAYETAMAAGDEDAASRAARTAWQAARDARIDPELVGILAENYGLLALSRGDYRQAQDAWRHAAEISDRLRAPATERALRWYQASRSAFQDGRTRQAYQFAWRSLRVASRSDAPVDATLDGDIHYMLAATSGPRGYLNAMAEHAGLALEAFESSGRSYDLIYANAYNLSGIGRYFEDDSAGAMFDFHMARSIFRAVGAERATITEAGYWFDLGRQEASEEELAALDARIAASAFPDTDFSANGPGTEMWTAGAPNAVEAVPLRRIEPSYSYDAAAAGVEGIVLMRFAVTETGRTDAIEVVAAAPRGVFDENSKQAVRQWRYEPARIDGQPVRREGVTVQLRFSLCQRPTVEACRRRYDGENAAQEDEAQEG